MSGQTKSTFTSLVLECFCICYYIVSAWAWSDMWEVEEEKGNVHTFRGWPACFRGRRLLLISGGEFIQRIRIKVYERLWVYVVITFVCFRNSWLGQDKLNMYCVVDMERRWYQKRNDNKCLFLLILNALCHTIYEFIPWNNSLIWVRSSIEHNKYKFEWVYVTVKPSFAYRT